MKLIITGATGFVAGEVLRQALLLPSITSVVAVARRSVSPPEGLAATNASKLKSIVVQDYGSYSTEVQKELEGAGACIWTVAVLPNKAREMPVDTVREICQDWTLAGLRAILGANPSPKQPIRFMYMSGVAALDPARPHSKDRKVWTPKWMVEYGNMRGETATKLFDMAEENKSLVEVCIAKPGFISGQAGIWRNLLGTALWLSGAVATISVEDVSAAMLDQVVRGFNGTDGMLLNEEMVEIGKSALSSSKVK